MMMSRYVEDGRHDVSRLKRTARRENEWVGCRVSRESDMVSSARLYWKVSDLK
jgi:hypothetical protein